MKSFGWNKTKKAVKVLFSLWFLKKWKLPFMGKVKKKRF